MKLTRTTRWLSATTAIGAVVSVTFLFGCGKLKTSAADPAPLSVTGNVLLNGVPPPEVVIPMSPACAELQTNTPTTRHYVVGPNRGLANVFVTIRARLDPKLFPLPTNASRISVIACQYQPYVLGVRAGQPIDFENNTKFLDNWHFTPKINPEFNFVGMPGRTQTKAFQSAEEFIRVKCDVHPWMFAYICVVDHPFFAITDTNGSFTLPKGLPDGTYELEARHLKAGLQQKHITVRNGRTEPIEFVYTVPKW